ncbi:MAG: DUF2262 domain-containing protein [Ruminococcus flavefaciens]|nr:DUF2262 domain-containing protein [Ruminococcus flavefaciens]
MSKIGMENVPENVDGNYHKEEKEFLVLCVHTPETASQLGGNDYWTKSVKILGYVENESGRTSSTEGNMSYTVKEHDEPEFFTKDGIYRVKGRLPKLIDGAEPWVNNEYRMSGLYVTEIISDNEENDFLENLLTEYNKEVSIYSEVLGKLILDRQLDWYQTENNLEWCGEDDVEFSISPDGETDINEFLPLAEEFYKNR